MNSMLINQDIHYSKNKIGYFIFLLAYFSLCFYSAFYVSRYRGENRFLENIFFLLISISFMIFARNRKINVHIIPTVLACRSVVLIYNVIFVLETTPMWILSREAMTLCAVLVFTFAYNFTSKERTELKILCASMTFIISAQIICTCIIGGGVKSVIYSFIGYHNYSITFLILFTAYLLFSDTDIFGKVVCVLALFATVLSQSFGGMFVMVGIWLFFIVKKLNWKNKNTCIYTILGLIIFTIVLFLSPIKERIFTKISQLFEGDYQSFGTGRLGLFEFSWGNIKRNIFLGILDNYNPEIFNTQLYSWFQHYTTHNHFLESMLVYGIVGTVFNVTSIVLVFVLGIKRCIKDKTRWPIFYGILAVFVHGFVEPSFLTMYFTLFFWLFAGVLVAPIKPFNCGYQLGGK